MPFRSEAESLREQIRRVEESTRELLDEQRALEAQRDARRPSAGRLVALVSVAVVALTGLLGHAAGSQAAEKIAARARARLDLEQATQLDGERQRLLECQRSVMNAEAEYVTCVRDVASMLYRYEAPPGAPGSGGLWR